MYYTAQCCTKRKTTLRDQRTERDKVDLVYLILTSDSRILTGKMNEQLPDNVSLRMCLNYYNQLIVV